MKTVMVLGCDGYIGTPLTLRLLLEGFKVVGVDNGYRRVFVEKEMNSYSATKILPAATKNSILKKLGKFTYHDFDIACDKEALDDLVNKTRPDTIINLAHQPSGPYSMTSGDHANFTLMNNIIGTNNIIWAVKRWVPECHLVTLGTTGEYDHYSNIDIEEGYLTIDHNGRTSNELIYPRRPGSVYHVSKTASTYLLDLLVRSWNIRCTDIMQAVVFGGYTPEIDQTKIYTRFDSDEAFGTVLNRFIVQALLEEPLTVYGEGNHQRGFIALNDSIQALMIAIKNVPDKGKVRVWNQLSEWHTINNLAETVKQVASELNIEVAIQNIPTPRNEVTEEHYYNYKTDILKSLGYSPTRSIEDEIRFMFKLLDKDHIQNLKNVVLPEITWK